MNVARAYLWSHFTVIRMHIPSAQVYREMQSEGGGLWIVPANGGEETALLVKAPTPTLKAMLAGSPAVIVCGAHRGFLCAGIRIHDVPEAPVTLCSVERHEERQRTLYRVLSELGAPLFLFNEMDACVAWTNVTINGGAADAALSFLENLRPHYTGRFNAEASLALDCFLQTLDPSVAYPGASTIPVIEIPIQVGVWTANNISYFGRGEHETISIDDRDEGAVLERVIWASLESVFPTSLYKAPMVRIGAKLRELTDVLAFHQYGSIFIEAKDLSIFDGGTLRPRSRRAKGMQAQARKAITQLIGASKAAKRGEHISDSRGKVIYPVLDQPIHCVVLLTELMHEGDWSVVEEDLRSAMIETGDFFHLMDLRELVLLLKLSSGMATRFDYNLIERCKKFVDAKTVHIRSRLHPAKPGSE